MHSRIVSTYLFLGLLLVALTAAGSTPLAAQQSAAVEIGGNVPSPQVDSATSLLPGPRLVPLVESVSPVNGVRVDGTQPAFPLAAEGGRHTIVISTLALVLAVVIIVLLVK